MTREEMRMKGVEMQACRVCGRLEPFDPGTETCGICKGHREGFHNGTNKYCLLCHHIRMEDTPHD